MKKKRKRALGTERFLALGFAGMILLGACLLCLPVSSAEHTFTNFIDALFTATTCVCVTGLVTVPTAVYWSRFGKAVILLLIQFGGLGIMACFSMVFLVLKKKFTLQGRKLIQDTYNLEAPGGVVGMMRRILLGTFIAEGIGAVFYSFYFVPAYGLLKGIRYSVFHAVSAFCNAGVDIVGDASFTPFLENPLINLTTIALIIVSGLGFPVWWELGGWIKSLFVSRKQKKTAVQKLSVHARLVLVMTAALVIGGTLLILVLDWNHPSSLGPLDVPHKLLAALFQSVTTRTAGFETIPQKDFSDASALVSMCLMMIGGSPMGTAGGVKTTTVAVLLLMVWSYIRGNEETSVYNRRIPETNIRAAVVVFFLALGILFAGAILLAILTDAALLDCLYETLSALATVGLTRSLTPLLPVSGKLLIILLMFMGRIGPITLAVAIGRKYSGRTADIHLPKERLLIG